MSGKGWITNLSLQRRPGGCGEKVGPDVVPTNDLHETARRLNPCLLMFDEGGRGGEVGRTHKKGFLEIAWLSQMGTTARVGEDQYKGRVNTFTAARGKWKGFLVRWKLAY